MAISDARDKSRLQFTISTAFCFLTAVAILCALARWERTFPYSTITPAAVFVTACIVACRAKSPDLAWGLITIGWLITFIDVVNSLMDSFSHLGRPPSAREMQSLFLHAYGSAVALPMFLTIPSVYLAVRASCDSSSPARKWIIASALIAFADGTLATALLLVLFEYT